MTKKQAKLRKVNMQEKEEIFKDYYDRFKGHRLDHPQRSPLRALPPKRGKQIEAEVYRSMKGKPAQGLIENEI